MFKSIYNKTDKRKSQILVQNISHYNVKMLEFSGLQIFIQVICDFVYFSLIMSIKKFTVNSWKYHFDNVHINVLSSISVEIQQQTSVHVTYSDKREKKTIHIRLIVPTDVNVSTSTQLIIIKLHRCTYTLNETRVILLVHRTRCASVCVRNVRIQSRNDCEYTRYDDDRVVMPSKIQQMSNLLKWFLKIF